MRHAMIAGLTVAGLAAGAGVAATATGSGGLDSATAAARPTLRLTPSTAPARSVVTFSGRHWRARSTVTLLIGPPRSEADAFATTRTSSSGTFRKRVRLSAYVKPGKWVVLACRRQCRIKAQANLTVTR